MIWLSDVDLCLWLIDANDLIEWCRFVSQCVAVCCSVLQYDSWTRTIWLSDVDLRYSVLQCAAVCCSVLQCVAVWLIDTNDIIAWCRFVSMSRVYQCLCTNRHRRRRLWVVSMSHTATHCSTLQHIETQIDITQSYHLCLWVVFISVYELWRWGGYD